MSTLENLNLQRAIRGDSEWLANLQPVHFTDDNNYTIVRYIHALQKSAVEVTFDSIRSAVNQDTSTTYKAPILNHLKYLEDTAFGHYDGSLEELKQEYVYRETRNIGNKLSKAGTDECTMRDIELLSEQVQDVYRNSITADDCKEYGDVRDELLEKDEEDFKKERVYVKDQFLQRIFGRYIMPRLYVISGPSSYGKSILADELVCDLLPYYSGAYFSFDNSREETVMSLLSHQSRVNYANIETNKYNQTEYARIECARQAKREKLWIIERKQTARQIRANIEKLVKRNGIRFVLLDYFTKIVLPNEKESTQQYMAAVQVLGQVCSDFKIPFISLSQVNDEGNIKWCRELFDAAYYVVKIDGDDRESNKRVIRIEKYKKGALYSFQVEYEADVGKIFDGRY